MQNDNASTIARDSSDTPHRAEDSISALSLGVGILRHRRLLLSLPLAALLLAVAYSIWRTEFVATARIVPQTTSGANAQLAGLAAQFGVTVAAGGGESVDFYAQLITSRSVLTELALTEYRFPVDDAGGDTLVGNVLTLLKVGGDTEERRVQRAVELLEDAVSVSTDIKSGLVTVRTSAPWRALAVAYNRRLLDLVNDFNLQRRQSQAGKERRFIERRLVATEGELRAAEQDLQRFYEANRRWEESPRLRLRVAQLQRLVDVRQQVYLTLSQAYEQARISEVRDTPVITVIDPPEGSAKQDRGLVRNSLVALAFSFALAGLVVLSREHLAAERRQGSHELAEFERLRREVIEQLKPSHIARAFRRGRRSRP